MTYRFDGYNHMLVLKKGELLIKTLSAFVAEQNIQGAWINGLGGAQWAELGFYDLENRQYAWRKLDQLLEITSLQGNVAVKDGRPALHLHATLSDEEMRAYGGHVKELEVGGTCELFLHTIFKEGLSRAPDQQTGLNLLQL